MTSSAPAAPAATTAGAPLRILHWHVHGSWSTAFVQGRHTYLLPVLPERGPWGGGRPAAWDWPASAVEVTREELARDADGVDIAVLQRPEEIELVARWTGRPVGSGPGALPAVYVEHNTPRGDAPTTRHVLADRDDIPIVHVTHFNALMWDCGRAPVHVVEHGVPDPGHRYTGELDRAGVVVNEPVRRARVTGTDLLERFAGVVGLDVFGIGTDRLPEALRRGDGTRPDVAVVGDLPQARMHAELARRRVYLHPVRWTSLGLSLIEAMMLGMPVVGLATAEAAVTVPPGAGVVATDLAVLDRALRELRGDPELARATGARAREVALARHGVARFLTGFDDVVAHVLHRAPVPAR